MTVPTVRRLESIAEKLHACGQQHLLRFFDQLDPARQAQLLDEIEQLDLAVINELTERYVRHEGRLELQAEQIQPAAAYPARPGPELEDKYTQARAVGERLIEGGKVAAFTVAGGQGTRLNFPGPKGNVPASPVKHKTLFQLFAEGIAASQRRYRATIPWYIMTSPANHDETVRTFQDKDYFGLNPDDVMHFAQGTMPSFDRAGRILLAERHRLALSPDGHGGSLRALDQSGALEDMARRGVECISYFQIDNPLVYVVDPLFIGLHVLDGAEMSSKAVTKCGPREKVGNFALVDGRVTVIEYSDLPDELARRRRDDGRLLFELGSVAIHIINRDFVARLNERGFSLPWHRALKKVPYIDESGRRVEPAEPNAVKLETFVFDALGRAEKSVILQIERDEQFAPIKNATGTDSLESSRRLQVARAGRWLEQAGIAVARKPDGTPDATLEISASFALDPDEVKQKRDQLQPVPRGAVVYYG